MENIKTQLLEEIEDINTLVDFQNDDDQVLYLNSKYYDEATQIGYDMTVEVVAHMDERFDAGDYHSDRGDYESRGSHCFISSISVQSITVITFDGDEANITITNQEAEEAVKF